MSWTCDGRNSFSLSSLVKRLTQRLSRVAFCAPETASNFQREFQAEARWNIFQSRALCVRHVSSRAGETSRCDWLRGSDYIRDSAGATTTLESRWEFSWRWDYLVRPLTPCFKNEHVTVILSLKDISPLAGTLDLGHINMFHRSWITLPPANMWRHLNQDPSLFFHLVWGSASGVKPQRDTCSLSPDILLEKPVCLDEFVSFTSDLICGETLKKLHVDGFISQQQPLLETTARVMI